MATKYSDLLDTDDPEKFYDYLDERDYHLAAEDIWTYPLHETSSAAKFLSDFTCNYQASELCNFCLEMKLDVYPSTLHDPQDGCVLCQIFKSRIKESNALLLDARNYIRICAVPGAQDNSPRLKIQPGLPVFLQSGGPDHFKLIKWWLQLCDQGECGHRDGCCPWPNVALPTRVIDVRGSKNGPDTVCLISSKKILADNRGKGARYVALSHCWGEPAKGQIPSWCTTRSNEMERMSGFPVEQMPATFQDAIRVTREIGQRYLWIDSLCIIQGDKKDWETEAKKMETVFKNAYCTIAATSAEDSTKGFLNRPVEESDLQYVTVPNSSHGKVYICTSVDDFRGDVEDGVLNKRAWVLQERALSRRIIHFTKRQTYWECGGGVRCETFTHMRNAKTSFQSDPDFPNSITGREKWAQVKLAQSLFTEFTSLGITNKTDRSVAIDSLARELAKVWKTKVRYGIFERYLHRSLLWHLSQKTNERISDAVGRALPSWSWMAYPGQIEYLEIDDAAWDKSVRFVKDKASNPASDPVNDGYILEARVHRITPKCLERFRCNEKTDKGVDLWFDPERKVSKEIRCAIMGREKTVKRERTVKIMKAGMTGETGKKIWTIVRIVKKVKIGKIGEILKRGKRVKNGNRKYYVLVVTKDWESGSWMRVGIGSIERRFLLLDGQEVAERII